MALSRNDIKIEITGILSWALLTFGVLKLCLVYASETNGGHLLTAWIVSNSFSVVYLLFFYGYYRIRYTFLLNLKLTIFFNLALLIYELLYNQIILIYKIPLSYSFLMFVLVLTVNLVISSIVYAFINKFRKNE